MAYVSLSKMPKHAKEYVVDFPQLNGGLNLQQLDYRIQNDESPEMKNLWWKDGVLCSRDGQAWVNDTGFGEFHACYDTVWNGYMFVHAGTKIYAVKPVDGTGVAVYTGDSGFKVGGTFFPYNEKLYYKTDGYYVEISYTVGTGFTGADIDAYVPVTYINCDYRNGSGDAYQPENRISAEKTLWYNAAYTLDVTPTGDIVATIEDASWRMRTNTPGTYTFTHNGSNWTLSGVDVDPLDFGIHVAGTPVSGNKLVVKFEFVSEFYLPVSGDSVTEVTVEDVEKDQEECEIDTDTDYVTATVNRAVWRNKVTTTGTYNFVFDYDAPEAWKLNGAIVNLAEYGISVSSTRTPIPYITGDTITVDYVRGDYYLDGDKVGFFVAPTCYYPEINNTIHITYELSNPVAYNNIMDCTEVAVYGGTGSLTIVMAGSKTQPNAYFWNGQDSVSMNPSYFPMSQYQLASDMVDPITGFGKQQGFLIIFKKGSVGRTSLSTAEVEGRTTIDLPYVPINAKIGCDLPRTIQLIENNLTWCNTQRGVHFLANTSSAYENNVICISDKVEESNDNWTQGLLYDVRQASHITSHDDGNRYWLIVDDKVWLWDYYISNYKNPAWFYFENVNARGMIQEHADIWHFDPLCRLTKFTDVYADYGEGIDKVYRFATQYFGTYDNHKNVNSVIINLKPTTNSIVDVVYLTDYEERSDLTPLNAVSWSLVPRDLTFRNLSGSGFAKIFRRKPHCRRVQYFTMRLSNDTANMDMAVVSAQIYYIYQGGQR